MKSLDEMCSEMLDSHEGGLGKSFVAPQSSPEPKGHVAEVMNQMGGGELFTKAAPRGTNDVYLTDGGDVEVYLPPPVGTVQKSVSHDPADPDGPIGMLSMHIDGDLREPEIVQKGDMNDGPMMGGIQSWDHDDQVDACRALIPPGLITDVSPQPLAKSVQEGMYQLQGVDHARGESHTSVTRVEVPLPSGATVGVVSTPFIKGDLYFKSLDKTLGALDGFVKSGTPGHLHANAKDPLSGTGLVATPQEQEVAMSTVTKSLDVTQGLDDLTKALRGTPIGGTTPGGRKRISQTEYVDLDKYKMRVEGKGSKETAKKIESGIKESSDICKISPSVCEGNLGIPRSEMPQLPGSVISKFLDHMASQGAKVTKDATMKVGELKATQKEINAEKVQGMAASYKAGKFPNIKDAIIVSSDGYILDGHHRWAALLHESPGETMNVHKVDAPIRKILDEANKFEGVSQQAFSDPSSMKKGGWFPLGEALAKGINAMKGCAMQKACGECEKKDGCDHSDKDPGLKKCGMQKACSSCDDKDCDKSQLVQKSDVSVQGFSGAKTQGLEDLEAFAKGGIPTGNHTSLKKPKSRTQGESADGGSLEGDSSGASAAPNLDSKQGMNPGAVQQTVLSEDDATPAGQMQPHKKPMERATKSMVTPGGQRDMVAHENAVASSRLRKGAEERLFGNRLVDQVSADLVKADTFYVGGEEPSLHRQVLPLEGRVMCKSEGCEKSYSSMLTSCPGCGTGDVQHRIAPNEYVGAAEIRGHRPVLRKAREEPDIVLGERDFLAIVRQ